jgi:rhomboid protease GluP
MIYEPNSVAVPPPSPVSVRLPLAKPRVTYVLLAAVGLAFAAETVLGGSTNVFTLVGLGAQVNALVAQGAYWRLLSAMFLHIGLMHLAFNGWALFSLGREVEALYGSGRFTLIYLLAGLFGGLATYLVGLGGLSAGASGAIFGLVGAEIAYFLRNRRLFGAFSKQQLANLFTLVGINLVFGFTLAGVNNWAHLGGLAAGFALGWGLTPRYLLAWGEFEGADGASIRAPLLFNVNPAWRQALAVLSAVALLVAGVWLGNQR